jgi:RHS repeat-associated protein
VAAVTDEAGSVIERMAYDPWGKRRGVDGVSDVADSLVGRTTDRGFTEHEHLDEMGVVHMNGRIYDPLVGRFMSADPFIQAPSMLQSYNRYGYVMNNPLNLTDPSGFNWFTALNRFGDNQGASIIGWPFGSRGTNAVYNFLQGSGGYQVKSMAISALSLYCGYAVAACNGGGQAGLARAYGASNGDAFNTGGRAALSSALFQWAGTVGGDTVEGANSYGRYFAHAGAGCVSAAAGGGNCGQGAVSAVFGKFATNAIDAQPGEFDAFQAAATVVAGGVGSVLGGGKFENGARTAAYGYLFNALASIARRIFIPLATAAYNRIMTSQLTTIATEFAAAEIGLSVSGVAVTANTIGNLGEKALANVIGGKGQVAISAPDGNIRIVDALVGGIANEAKVGYVALDTFTKAQILKDAALVADGNLVKAAHWHFFPSPITGKSGASENVLDLLRASNIGYTIYGK